MSELSELKKQYERLGAEIEKLEQQPKPWPQAGDEYWCVDDEGDVIIEEYGQYHTVDRYRLATGNYHRTEAEALAYREWQADPRVVARAMIERQPGFDPQGDWMLASDIADCLYVTNVMNRYGAPQFTHKHLAYMAIEKLGEDLCKVALGVITDKEEAGRIVREAMGK